MACAASTKAAATGVRVLRLDLDRHWQLHQQVSVRPERFGALLYHFGTRRLSFLKSPALLTVVNSLCDEPSARDACLAAGVTDADLPAYASALATLAGSRMISESLFRIPGSISRRSRPNVRACPPALGHSACANAVSVTVGALVVAISAGRNGRKTDADGHDPVSLVCLRSGRSATTFSAASWALAGVSDDLDGG
jgi:putative mycofactocin binding protein MftB